MRGFFGSKKKMTQLFLAKDAKLIPVTFIEVEPNTIVQVKTSKKDGYQAVQLGYQAIKENKINKSIKGHFDHFKSPYFRKLKEIKAMEGKENDVITAELFQPGEFVNITTFKSKGKGFKEMLSGIILKKDLPVMVLDFTEE